MVGASLTVLIRSASLIVHTIPYAMNACETQNKEVSAYARAPVDKTPLRVVEFSFELLPRGLELWRMPRLR